MNRTRIAGAVLASLLIGACATSKPPPQALTDARSTIKTAQLDTAVLAHAPLELKKASDSLNRANQLQEKGEPVAEITSAAYIANQQAKTAMAVAQAKSNDLAIASAEVERERTRADMRTAEAQRAEAQANASRAQATMARQMTASAEQRANGAEAKAAIASASAQEAQQKNAELQKLLNEMQAKQTERGMLVTLGDVLFEFNRAEVKPGAQASLRKLADYLGQYPTRSILIEGHTDSIGSAAANAALSLRRADAVRNALQGMGVAAARVTTVGYGEEFPVADNATDTNRALNRRVEVYISDNDQPVRPRR